MTGETHEPCVCVFANLRESGSRETGKTEPQEGGVCTNSYTLRSFVRSFCSSSVVVLHWYHTVSTTDTFSTTFSTTSEVVA